MMVIVILRRGETGEGGGSPSPSPVIKLRVIYWTQRSSQEDFISRVREKLATVAVICSSRFFSLSQT